MLSRLLIRKRLLIESKRRLDQFSFANVRSTTTTTSQQVQYPKGVLNNHYQSQIDAKSFSAAFVASSVAINGQTWWTCTFTDPLNGVHVFETAQLPEDSFGKSMQHNDGKIYYTRQRSAQHGASQNAIERLGIDKEQTKTYKVANTHLQDYQAGELSVEESELQALIGNLDEYYRATNITLENKEWWTCNFHFAGVTHRPIQLTPAWGQTLIRDRTIFYETPKAARHAVTVAVLQSIRTATAYATEEESTVTTIMDNDYPSLLNLIDANGSIETMDQNETLSLHNTTTLTPSLGSKLDAASVETPRKTKVQPKKGKLLFGIAYIDDDENEEYTIHFESSPVSSESQSNGYSTLDRIMEAWVERRSTLQTEYKANGMPLPNTPIEQRRQILDDAHRWFNGLQQKTNTEKWWLPTFTHSCQFASTSAARSLLKALAKANEIAPCPTVEDTAEKVFYFISESTDTLTIETYNDWFKCMSGELSALRKAKKIERILTALKTSNSNNRPKPNSDTINIAILAWSHVGGKIAADAIDKLMKDTSSDFTPTRETYAALLASTTAKDASTGGLKAINCTRAKEIIREMNILSADNESLRPDTEICNIPIVSNTFDNHEVLFRDGFLQKEDKTWNHALSIENWVVEMEQGSSNLARPNIASYEAVIQAWVKTGTKLGLEKAESWALRALDGPVSINKPRLQTFHPILAAYAFTGQPSKLQEWTERLKEVGGSCQPDSRMRALEITAHLYAMKTLNGVSGEEKDDEITQHAETCYSLLQDLTSDVVNIYNGESQDSLFLESNAFVETAQAWKNVAAFRCQVGADVKYCVNRAVDVQELFNRTLFRLGSIDSDPEASVYLRQQLDHLRFNALQVNAATIAAFVDGSENHSSILAHTNVIDAMLRSAADYGHVLKKSTSHRHYSGEVMYSDLYSYHPNDLRMTLDDSSLYFCKNLATLCYKCSLSNKEYIDDLVNLCELILQVVTRLSFSNEGKNAMESIYASVEQVYFAIESKEERAAMFSHLLQIMQVSLIGASAASVIRVGKNVTRFGGTPDRSATRSGAQRNSQLSYGSEWHTQSDFPVLSEANEGQNDKTPVGGASKRVSRRGSRSKSRRSSWSV